MTDSDQGLKIRLADPRMGDEEVEAVREVLHSGILTNGPATRRFEELFAERHQVEHAVAVANGTVALSGIYLALGIGPGDEVIVPSMTFISTATSVLHVGADVVFADIQPDTLNVDPEDVARQITPKTKAIVAVHYGGQAADLDELRAIADDAGIHLVEDAAEAHGATYKSKPVGGFGTAGMFSFTPTKNITTGEGGMVTTNDETIAERLQQLRDHGQTSQYRHDVVGYNWRITEMQAALGCVQLGKLDALLERKRANAGQLVARLSRIDGITPPTERPDRQHVYMLYTVQIAGDRDRVLDQLHAASIEARIYFPPVHRQPIFTQDVRLLVTDDVAQRVLSLPFHAKLGVDDLEYICRTLECALGGTGPEG